MADPNVAVTGDQNTSVPSGTTGEGGVTQVTPSTGASDANGVSVEQLLAKLAQADEDRKRVQSLKDREVAAERQKALELAKQLEDFKKQGMSDAERVAFERDQYKQQYEALQAQAEQQRQMDEYATYLSQLGVDTSKLERTNPDAMANSAWNALVGRIKELEGRTATTPPQNTTPTNNSKVITGSGGVPHTRPTEQEMMKAVGARSLSDLYDWAERHPDAWNQWLKQE